MTNSLRLDLEEKNKVIDELKDKLKNASSKSIAELGGHKLVELIFCFIRNISLW